MARVLTAAKRPPTTGMGWPDASTAALPAVEAARKLDRLALEIADHLARRDGFRARRERLRAKLDDPALAGHPKRAEGEERWNGLGVEEGYADGLATVCVGLMTREWMRQSADGRARLADLGWATADADEVGFWEWVVAGIRPTGKGPAW